MFKEHNEEVIVEFKGAWELAQDLPDTVQEEEENRRLPFLLAVRVG